MVLFNLKKLTIMSILLGAFAIALSVGIAVLSPFETQIIPPKLPEAQPEITEAPATRHEPLDTHDTKAVIRFLHGGQIREISMSDYLIGAVAAEMPAVFEPNALCAQAVALRTYVLRHIMIAPPEKHQNADVCDDFGCCAAYNDEAALREKWGDNFETNLKKVESAVSVTDGIYITYDSEPILAVFHSSSYRATTGAEKVWTKPVPYLVGVPSPETEKEVTNLKSAVTITAADFKSTVIAAYPDAELEGDTRAWITEMKFDESGRVDTITIGGVMLTGPQLRALFMLRSTAVSVTLGNEIVFETMGYGHGVGMSQFGANIMAKGGATWRGIIKAYYTGVTLSDEEIFSALGAAVVM